MFTKWGTDDQGQTRTLEDVHAQVLQGGEQLIMHHSKIY